jgi:hypothetical protein
MNKDINSDMNFSNGDITSIAIEELHDIFEDEKAYWKKKYNHVTYQNQLDILNTICNPENHYINIIMARGSGKSHGVALAFIEQCINISKLKVAIFAPKSGQSKRLIAEMYEIINMAPQNIKDEVDSGNSTTMVLTFKNGSKVWALSGNERTFSEGEHPDVIVLDEAHMISDYSWSSKISPMLGSHGYYQIVKIGVAMGKGHFNKGFNDKKYINILCDWIHAERLKESGIFTYTNKDGITLDYPKYVVDALMPPGAKKKWFPDRPDLITGPGEVSELDWLMQYELQWLDSISLFLDEKQQKILGSGTHKLQIVPNLNEVYVFGLDTATGSPNLETMGLDYTALSIWMVRPGKLLKIFTKKWQGDPLMQYDEILDILKKFRVKYGMIDFSSLAPVFVDMLKRDGIKCEGILYHSNCPESHKDWKTTIFDNFLARLNLGQIQYPLIGEENYKEYKDNIEMMNNVNDTDDGFYEWCILQRIQSKNSSKIKISAPNKEHDDVSNSDCLSVYAAVRISKMQLGTVTSIPLYVSKGATLYSGGGSASGFNR